VPQVVGAVGRIMEEVGSSNVERGVGYWWWVGVLRVGWWVGGRVVGSVVV